MAQHEMEGGADTTAPTRQTEHQPANLPCSVSYPATLDQQQGIVYKAGHSTTKLGAKSSAEDISSGLCTVMFVSTNTGSQFFAVFITQVKIKAKRDPNELLHLPNRTDAQKRHRAASTILK